MGGVLFVALALGFLLFMSGVVASNVAVVRMMKVVNSGCSPAERIAPWRVIGHGAAMYKPAEKYRAKYPAGPLNRELKVAYWLCGIGGVMLFGSVLILKIQ